MNIQKLFQEMEETFTELQNNINLQKKELKEMVEYNDKKKKLEDKKFWQKKFKKLNKEKTDNKLKLIELRDKDKNLNDEIEQIEDIMGEFSNKNNYILHLNYLEQFMTI